MRYEQTILYVGIDIGSTTTKIVAVDAKDGTVLYSDYRRHHADQAASVSKAVWKLSGRFPGARLQPVLTGSGAKQLADALGLPFTQEVVANALGKGQPQRIPLPRRLWQTRWRCARCMCGLAPPLNWAGKTPK